MMNPLRVRFVHFADLHLDAPFREDGRTGYSQVRRRDLRDALTHIVASVREEQAQFLLISGDLYEQHYATRASITWVSQLFETLPIPIIILPGNHDPYAANAWYRLIPWPSNVTILHEGNPSVYLEPLQTFIYGIGFTTHHQGKPDLERVLPTRAGCFNILMLHGTMDLEIGNDRYNPVSSSELGALGYDYHALGHFHNSRTYEGLKNAFNPGSPEPLGFDEPGIHGILSVEAVLSEQDGISLTVKQIPIAARRYVEKTLDISGIEGIEELTARIKSVLEACDPQRDITRLTLTGRTPLVMDIGMLNADIFGQWLNGRILNDTQPLRDYEALKREPGLKGAFIREMQVRLGRCEDHHKTRMLIRAMELGLEALENGRIDSLKER